MNWWLGNPLRMSPDFTFAAVLVPRAHYLQREKICNMQIIAAPCTHPAAQSSDRHLTAQRLRLLIISGLKPRPLLQQNRQEMNYLTGPDSLSYKVYKTLLWWTLTVQWTQVIGGCESQLTDSETHPIEKLGPIFKQVLDVTTTFKCH